MLKKYRKRTEPIEAAQWMKHGDLPEYVHDDQEYLRMRTGKDPCPCGHTLEEHGVAKQGSDFTMRVCPGMWLVIYCGYVSRVVDDGDFQHEFEPI